MSMGRLEVEEGGAEQEDRGRHGQRADEDEHGGRPEVHFGQDADGHQRTGLCAAPFVRGLVLGGRCV